MRRHWGVSGCEHSRTVKGAPGVDASDGAFFGKEAVL